MPKPSPTKDHNGPGFVLGMTVGALVGTGTAFILGTKKGRQWGRDFLDEARSNFDHLRDSYPKQTGQIEDILQQAMEEARQATEEIKQVAGDATKKAKKEAEKHLFVKSGKPLKKASPKQS